jgi:plasmid stability protein
MTKMVQIRHMPLALHRTLQLRAARAGMSLSDYLRAELERVVERLPVEDLRARLAALEPVTVRETPVRAVRRERDRDRDRG